MKKPLCMMSILTTLMVSSQNAVGAVPTATIAPTTSIVCKSVSSYDQPNFIMNSGDRLLTKAEFNYYWGISDEDRKYLSEFQIMLSKFKISILALPIPYQAALYIDSRNNPAPGRYDPLQALENYRTQIKNLNDHGFTALDLQEIAKKMPQGTDFFARRDHHWTSEAMEKVADAVKITVDKLNLNIDRNAITSLRGCLRP